MGSFYVEMEGLSSLELMFDQCVDKLLDLQRKYIIAPRGENSFKKQNIFYQFPHSDGTRMSSAVFSM